MSLKVLLLAGFASADGNDEDKDEGKEIDRSVFGLVVIDAGNSNANEMQRVGWMSLHTREAERIQGEEANWRTVKLI